MSEMVMDGIIPYLKLKKIEKTLTTGVNYLGIISNLADVLTTTANSGDFYKSNVSGLLASIGTEVKIGDTIIWNGTGWDVISTNSSGNEGNTILFASKKELNNHIDDSSKHVSTSDRYNWDNKANGTFETTQVDIAGVIGGYSGGDNKIIDSKYLFNTMFNAKNLYDSKYALQEEFDIHKKNATIHLSEAEKQTLHIHINKNILDSITEDDDTGEMLYKGNPLVSSMAREHLSNKTIHVTQSERDTWNNKANIKDIPIVPTKVSELANDKKYITLEDLSMEEGGGVLNYNGLSNKPSISGVELSGNKTLSDLNIQEKIDNISILESLGISSNNKLTYNGTEVCSTEGSGSGTNDYELLSNKPSIAGVELSGDLTLNDLGIQSILSNYDSLSKLSINDEGKLEVNGVPISAEGEGSVVVDSSMSLTSTNPVQNKVIYKELSNYILKSDVSEETLAKFTSGENGDVLFDGTKLLTQATVDGMLTQENADTRYMQIIESAEADDIDLDGIFTI